MKIEHVVYDTEAYKTLLKSMAQPQEQKDNSALLDLFRKNRGEYIVRYLNDYSTTTPLDRQ